MAVLKTLKIATRQSPLALWQANFVKDQLEKFHPTLSVELVPMVTKGDVILDSPLAKFGDQVLITPHSCPMTYHDQYNMDQMAAENTVEVLDLIRGKK